MHTSFSGRVASVPVKSVEITKAKKVRGSKANAVAAPTLDTRQSERVSAVTSLEKDKPTTFRK